jgi:hypothetical protein
MAMCICKPSEKTWELIQESLDSGSIGPFDNAEDAIKALYAEDGESVK